MSLPKTKTSAITNKINLLSQKSSVSPFEVKSLQREIDTLMQVDAGEAYMLGGMLYSLVNDYDQSKLRHEKSLKLSFSLVEIVNYAVSMKRLGRVAEALFLFLKAVDSNPGDQSYVASAFQLMTFSGDFEKFDSVLSRFKKSNPTFDFREMPNVAVIESIREHLQVIGVPEAEFKLAGSLVERALTEHGYHARQMFEKVGSFDGEQHIYVELGIDAKSSADLVSINDRIADLILSSEQLTCWDKLVYNVVCFHPADNQAA